MALTDGIDAYFFLTAAGLLFGSIALCVRYGYRSKCKSVKCCCLKIERDIEVEKEEDMEQMKNLPSPIGRPSSLSS